MKDDYYDLLTNKTFIRGYESKKVEESKHLKYPDIFPNIYIITRTGQIYSTVDDLYIRWDYINKFPSVNLLCRKIEGEPFIKKRYLIKDLMAYSYIANANNYLERGCKIVNIDGDPNNCNYNNIIFLDPEKEY